MFENLKEAEAKFEDISEKLTLPEVISDTELFKKLSHFLINTGNYEGNLLEEGLQGHEQGVVIEPPVVVLAESLEIGIPADVAALVS